MVTRNCYLCLCKCSTERMSWSSSGSINGEAMRRRFIIITVSSVQIQHTQLFLSFGYPQFLVLYLINHVRSRIKCKKTQMLSSFFIRHSGYSNTHLVQEVPSLLSILLSCHFLLLLLLWCGFFLDKLRHSHECCFVLMVLVYRQISQVTKSYHWQENEFVLLFLY